MCQLWVSNLERSTHRVLNVVIGTPKPSSRTKTFTLEKKTKRNLFKKRILTIVNCFNFQETDIILVFKTLALK